MFRSGVIELHWLVFMNNLMLEDFIAVDFRDCFGIIYDVLAIWIYEHETFNNKSHVVLEGGKNERVI